MSNVVRLGPTPTNTVRCWKVEAIVYNEQDLQHMIDACILYAESGFVTNLDAVVLS